MMVEQTPKGDSQSNGAVEEAGKAVREMAKVFRNVIEENIKDKLKVEAAIMVITQRHAGRRQPLRPPVAQTLRNPKPRG